MDNAALFQKINAEIQEIDARLAGGELSLDERQSEVGKIELRYEIGLGMKNELGWKRWELVNLPLGPTQRYFIGERVKKLELVSE